MRKTLLLYLLVAGFVFADTGNYVIYYKTPHDNPFEITARSIVFAGEKIYYSPSIDLRGYIKRAQKYGRKTNYYMIKKIVVHTDPPEIPELWRDKIVNTDGEVIAPDKIVTSVSDEAKQEPAFEPYEFWGGFITAIPAAPFGFLLGLKREKGPGYFLTMKMNIGRDINDHMSDELARALGDKKLKEASDDVIANLGFVLDIAPDVKLLGSVGWCYHRIIHQYYDPLEILSTDGKYWVVADRQNMISFMGGLMIPINDNNLHALIAAEVQPFSINVGVVGF